MVGMSVLGIGCGQPPTPLTPGEGSSGSPSTTTSGGTSGDATVVVDGSTAVGGSSGASSAGPTSADGGSSSEGGSSSGGPVEEPLGPFGPPVEVVELNEPFSAEDDPTLTGDMLEIFFASTRNASEDVFTSTRASVDDPWNPPVEAVELNTISTETTPEVSIDGLVLTVASNRAGALGTDIYISWRATRADPWVAPVPLAMVNTPNNDFGATLSPDMSQLFLCWDNQPGGVGQGDVWQTAIDLEMLMVGVPTLVAELSTPQAECTVSMSLDQRELFFETTRLVDGGDVTYDWDVWMAVREDAADPWGAPVRVTEIDTPDFDDIDPWLSLDRRTLYMASNRVDYDYDIYVTTRR